MPLPTRNVKRALSSKLHCDVDDTGPHIFYYFVEDGKSVTSTMVSHGPHRDIGDPLVGKMARQLHVKKRFFEELVRCTKSRNDYVDCLRTDGHLD